MSLRNPNRREICLLNLPDDFLRISSGPPSIRSSPLAGGTENDELAAITLHHQLNSAGSAGGVQRTSPYSQNNFNMYVGRLLISVMQAKLVKNYGLLFRMDPFVRISVGHTIYETPTAVSGGKNPKWNKSIQCFLPKGVTEIYLEIYDEVSFGNSDELIASSNILLPMERLLDKKETVEAWYNLSGKQGKDKEGEILLVFSLVPFNMGPPHQQHPVRNPNNLPDVAGGQGQGSTETTAVVPPVNQVSEEEKLDTMKMFSEMFPEMDPNVVKTVYYESGYDRNEAVNTLIVLSTADPSSSNLLSSSSGSTNSPAIGAVGAVGGNPVESSSTSKTSPFLPK